VVHVKIRGKIRRLAFARAVKRTKLPQASNCNNWNLTFMKLGPKRYPAAASISCVSAVQSVKLTLVSDTFARHDATGCLGIRSWFVVSSVDLAHHRILHYTYNSLFTQWSIATSTARVLLISQSNWVQCKIGSNFSTIFLWLNKCSSDVIRFHVLCIILRTPSIV